MPGPSSVVNDPEIVPAHGVCLSRTEAETLAFARRLAESLTPPALILLEGELGAGKTTFTKGLAAGFGVQDLSEVSSPTFTLVNRYRGDVVIYHVDLYRVDSGDLYDLGLEDIMAETDSVTIIEWADRLGDLPLDAPVNVSLAYVDEHTRRIEVRSDTGSSAAME